MMNTENLLLSSLSLIILQLLTILETCDATSMSTYYCTPSSCGAIRNISFPFRLKDDPKHCGNPIHQLECENNTKTILYLNSHRYRVKAINYDNFTIRLADDSIDNNNTCSFPKYSASSYNFSTDRYPYSVQWHSEFPEVALPINFMSCSHPLKTSSFYTELATHCGNSSNTGQAYTKVGHMNASDLPSMCSVDFIVLTSWKFKGGFKNVLLSEIHEALLYGFELLWLPGICSFCRTSRCFVNEHNNYYCSEDTSFLGKLFNKLDHIRYFTGYYGQLRGPILIIALVAVVFFAGVSFPAKIIVGFTSVLGILIFVDEFSLYHSTDWISLHPGLFIGLIFAARFIIIVPFVMWIFIFRFRRRHTSMFHAIESFLQSDNKLVPIRYSYLDIKKMTRGFREKLGQGGYGSVYKGKLRSGHDAAVKLLRKPGGNGQDFMNEIATIGRIHHVNVVKLVGYCAERSKRALVFDYMPNSSLDKYIYSPEKMKSLSWNMKLEIAIGVARGIEYLHRGCDFQILHFDIKPHNILLDDKFTPKISDFGLAKYCSTDKDMVTLTAARGTIGYVAPELINRGIGGVSYKADVYSFGMLLIEMVGLKRDLKGNNQTSSKYFPCWIYDRFEEGKNMDIEIGVSNDDEKIGKKMTIVALWCIQMSPSDRPSMKQVVQMLESRVERLRIPDRPIQSAQVAINYDDQNFN